MNAFDASGVGREPAGPIDKTQKLVELVPLTEIARQEFEANWRKWDHPVSDFIDWQLDTGKDFNEFFESPNAFFFVVNVDGRFAGLRRAVIEENADGRFAEFSAWVAPDRRRQGASSASAVQLCELLFEEHGVLAAYAFVDPANVASTRALQKAGFRHVPENVDVPGYNYFVKTPS